jgi:hypothetical protein
MTPLDVLRYRYYEAFLRRDSSGPVRVQPEAITRTLAPADPGTVVAVDFDRQVASAVAPDASHEREPPTLAGILLPPLEGEAVRYVRSLAHPADEEREAPDLTGAVARLTQALRRWHRLSNAIAAPGSRRSRDDGEPWRVALQQLRAFAMDGRPEELLRTVVGAINRLHHLEALREDDIVRRQIDPAGFRDPARLALELDLGVEFETRLARGPVLPATVRPWLESAASEIYLESRPKLPGGPSRPWARLHLSSRFVEALLGVRAGYTYLGTLGPYRRDLARFHSHLLSLAREAGLVPRITLRVGSAVYRATSVPHRAPGRDLPARLRFEGEG